MTRKRVAVSHYIEGSDKVTILARFHTIEEAEAWIAEREKVDPAGVHAGDYGIDAPESMINP